MSDGLIFDESAMLDGNIFKFEQRLQSQTNRYIENGAILTKYWNIRDTSTTVDRGFKSIEELFGRQSPLRFNKIINFPLYGFGAATPSNTDEQNVEDINVEGECLVQPGTIVPCVNDCFMVNHIKMRGLFQVKDVKVDNMKREGFYKITYHLYSTSFETIQRLEHQTEETFHCDLKSIGSNLNPIIQKDDFIKRNQIEKMINSMIECYRSSFYNERHNCFLMYTDENERWFDMCGNEFIAKHSIMNFENSTKVIMLHEKLNDPQMGFFYNNSIYKWIEMDCPRRMLHKFHFILNDGTGYLGSTFERWYEDDIKIIQPISMNQAKINFQDYSFFDDAQLKAFNSQEKPYLSEYEQLIYDFMNDPAKVSIDNVSLYTADSLLTSSKKREIFLYTPIIIYIIRKILRAN